MGLLFDQLVWPVLTYGCEVWGFSNISQIDVIQRKFIKSILHLNSSTPNSMIYGETGTLPIAYHIKSRMINFFMRLLNGKQSKFSCIMYKVWRKKSEQGCNFDWIDTASLSWSNLCMHDTWMFNGNGFTPSYIKEAVKLRTKDILIQEIYSDKNYHNYCRIYNVVKNNWKFEQYLIDLNFFPESGNVRVSMPQ